MRLLCVVSLVGVALAFPAAGLRAQDKEGEVNEQVEAVVRAFHKNMSTTGDFPKNLRLCLRGATHQVYHLEGKSALRVESQTIRERAEAARKNRDETPHTVNSVRVVYYGKGTGIAVAIVHWTHDDFNARGRNVFTLQQTTDGWKIASVVQQTRPKEKE